MVVTPGENIAIAEEFMPGVGAYERDGEVFAAVVGEPKFDQIEREVRIDSPRKIPRRNVVGSIVYGRVVQVYDKYAVVELFPYNTRRFRLVPPSRLSTIRIANIRRGFVKTVRDEFGVGDWIRAKILKIQKRFYVDLSTEGSRFGVIKAYCPKCRRPLVRRGATLYCPRCKLTVKRKIAEDYGNPVLPR